MFGLLGASAGRTMAMTQEQPVDRIGASAAPDSEKPNVDKRALRAAGASAPPSQPRWIRNVNDYHRRQPREYACSRYG
jgi:hypothetical protein